MKTSKPPEMMPGREAILETAADWLARCGAGLTPAESAEFNRWRDADPRHAWAFEQVQATQHLLLRLPESPAAAKLMAEADALMRQPRRARVARFPWTAAAFAAAACVALALWLAWPVHRSPDQTTYATAAGHRQSFNLSDGSTLVMSGDSEVQVAFAAAQRRVQLRRGETHFFVAKDPDRPFLVEAGSVTIRAVGTAFNVRRDVAAVEVLVTEGKVQVSRESAMAGASGPEPIYLVSGERVLIETPAANAPALAAQNPSPAPLGNNLSRTAPRLFFSDTPLAEVVERFNRYNQLQMEIAEPALGQRAVGGNFDADNAESFIALLATSGDVRVERLSPTRVRLHRAR